MSSLERRKLCCSITFHLVAITCVIWSLYVLIERTTHEIEEGDLQWPFWTKLIVVAIGFTGGQIINPVFMKDATQNLNLTSCVITEKYKYHNSPGIFWKI